MRADRLVSLVLLLRQRGQLTAATLARELEVSTRTVLRHGLCPARNDSGLYTTPPSLGHPRRVELMFY